MKIAYIEQKNHLAVNFIILVNEVINFVTGTIKCAKQIKATLKLKQCCCKLTIK